MPKMTAKYAAAVNTAHNHKLPTLQTRNQEELYSLLQQNGFFWDSQAKRWEYHEPAAADAPTPLVMVRVWADTEIVEEVADDITRQVKGFLQLVERSTPYQCRPPKQNESRVYLKFLPKPAAPTKRTPPEVSTGQLVPCAECGQLYHDTDRWTPGRGFCPDCQQWHKQQESEARQ